MRAREDVSALLASGSAAYEVPFSMLIPGEGAVVGTPHGSVVLRGAIDCLIRTDDGSVVVVEFKSGTPRPAHQRQLDLYIKAARALFPEADVSGRLIYPDNPRPDPLLIPSA
jgi:ATP-dependent exoDNAse (exonuclease V) beta subunit